MSPALAFVGLVGLCLLVDAASATLCTGSARAWYMALIAPPAALPHWAYRPIWTALYMMLGAAAWLVWRRAGPCAPVRLWGWLLATNAVRAAAFFGLRNPALAVLLGIVAFLLLFAIVSGFRRASRVAAWLVVPSLLWTVYVLYLDAGFWFLNLG